jgi:hypothetical protein
MAQPLTLKRAPVGDNQDDCDVLEDGIVVGRIVLMPAAPRNRQAKALGSKSGSKSAAVVCAHKSLRHGRHRTRVWPSTNHSSAVRLSFCRHPFGQCLTAT